MKGMHSALASPNLNSSYTSRSGSPFPSLPSSPPLSSTDDVTTIFVVGFPDDMQEREFQNMFMFAKGFEAASLKWHCKDQQEDQDMCHATLNNKKQMIGFARFRTRYEAIEATNEINGKKIDMEKGCILKAEMAKKNLHIKRAVNPSTPTTTTTTTTTNTTTTTHNMNYLLSSAVQLPEPSSSPMTILTRNLSQAHPEENNRFQANSMDYESFLPLPSDLLSPTGNYKHDPFQLNDHHSFNDSLFCIRSHSYDGRNQNYQSDTTTTVTPFQFFSKSELNTDPFHYMSKSTPVPHHDSPSQLFNHQVEDLGLKGRKNSLHTIERSSSALSNSFRTTATATSCSANQNPPCNTLYVGNLPPSTSEDELRSLFETCEGYKRMCFRNKPQGPMCFVEFEDVIYATQAMNEHQGHILSNSVKGGIRLSFSKNPLFIKPSKEADISFNFKQMGTALLADL